MKQHLNDNVFMFLIVDSGIESSKVLFELLVAEAVSDVVQFLHNKLFIATCVII